MIEGSQVGTQLRLELDRASATATSLGTQLNLRQGELSQLRSEEMRAVAELARVRLGELAGNRIASGLDEADRQALEQLQQRDQERTRLEQDIEAGARQLAGLQQQHTQLTVARDQAGEARDRQIAATMQRLAATEAYAVQLAHSAHCAAQARNADEKADQAEADRDQKRKPYEQDKLFGYLWRRRYRFPEYRAMPLIRALDEWVAGLCRYDHAHRDYGMLLAIPDRLRQHAERLAAVATTETDKRTAMERQALIDDGVPALDDALQAAQRAVADAEARIEAAERQQDQLLVQRDRFDAGEDPFCQRAAAAIDAQLLAEDIRTLQADAAQTGTSADDEIVRRIAGLREQQESARAGLQSLAAQRERARAVRDELHELTNRFRREGYDAGDSLFDGLDLAGLLRGVLAGTVLSQSAWTILRGRQRRRPSNVGPIIGDIIGSAMRSGGSFGGSRGGGGGGGLFGGFGGGGFRSGGSFGGGGFRTGGKF